MSSKESEKHEHSRDRTCNPQIRSLMRFHCAICPCTQIRNKDRNESNKGEVKMRRKFREKREKNRERKVGEEKGIKGKYSGDNKREDREDR